MYFYLITAYCLFGSSASDPIGYIAEYCWYNMISAWGIIPVSELGPRVVRTALMQI